MLHVLRMCIIGLLARALAKLIMPSKALSGTIVKMLVGIAGRSGRGALVPKRVVQRAVAQGDAARVKLNLGCGRGALLQRADCGGCAHHA